MSSPDTIQRLTAAIVAWADNRFPGRTSQSAFLKFFEEMGELIKAPRNPGEYADVAIMLFDLANMHGVDMTKAIEDKLVVLHARKDWRETETGIFQHIDPLHTEWQPVQGCCNRELSDGSRCRRSATDHCEACL